jgi:hypothetical protein
VLDGDGVIRRANVKCDDCHLTDSVTLLRECGDVAFVAVCVSL